MQFGLMPANSIYLKNHENKLILKFNNFNFLNNYFKLVLNNKLLSYAIQFLIKH